MAVELRYASPSTAPTSPFGLLANLPGSWSGSGFNVITRPNKFGVSPSIFFLELNATTERIEFTAIGGDVPNRGSIEPDALLHAITYLQSVNDVDGNVGIHKEPGLWVHVPPTKENASETYVRQATIPHGDALIAQSTFFTTVAGGPVLNPVSTLPFNFGQPLPPLNGPFPTGTFPLGYLDPLLHPKLPAKGLPAGVTPAIVTNPVLVLQAQLAEQAAKGQKPVSTVVIQISTQPTGGILNIPFVTANANASSLDAIFWIETILDSHSGRQFLQLQYVQRVILDFDNIHWPHISVATLIKE